jgi:hypothetical protein
VCPTLQELPEIVTSRERGGGGDRQGYGQCQGGLRRHDGRLGQEGRGTCRAEKGRREVEAKQREKNRRAEAEAEQAEKELDRQGRKDKGALGDITDTGGLSNLTDNLTGC